MPRRRGHVGAGEAHRWPCAQPPCPAAGQPDANAPAQQTACILPAVHGGGRCRHKTPNAPEGGAPDKQDDLKRRGSDHPTSAGFLQPLKRGTLKFWPLGTLSRGVGVRR